MYTFLFEGREKIVELVLESLGPKCAHARMHTKAPDEYKQGLLTQKIYHAICPTPQPLQPPALAILYLGEGSPLFGQVPCC